MHTLDGKQEFDAGIACADNDKLAEITYSSSGGAAPGEFGSGMTNISQLSSIYDSRSLQLPDGRGELASQMSDEDSLYNLVIKGNQNEFAPGSSIGMPTIDKCEIKNIP